MIKEGDIDAALSEAQQAVEELAQATGATLEAKPPGATAGAGDKSASSEVTEGSGESDVGQSNGVIDLSTLPPAMQRLFKVRVAVRVRLAERRMTVGDILQLSNGAILEFETPVQSPLKLLVNNKCVGTGDAVKVGENFGLRVRYVGDAAERLATMGGAA